MKSIAEISDAVFDGHWEELPAWPCPGCDATIRAADGRPRFRGSVETYAYEVCCSACAPSMLSKHLPRAEVLRKAGAPQNMGKTFRVGLVPDERASRWPWDARQPDIQLEAWTGDPVSVVLTGPNGRGKSMLAAEFLVRLYRSGLRSQLWIRPSVIIAEHFSHEQDRYRRRLSEAVQVLVLDEFGRGQHSGPFACALIGEILDTRISEGRVTIITTNLPIGGKGSIEEADSAVFDRLTTGLLIPMCGRSYRTLPAYEGNQVQNWANGR